MSDAVAFERVCTRLEESTSLDRLAARGTVRIAVKEAGLDVGTVTAQQMMVVVTRLLPAQLASRGVEDTESVCAALKTELAAVQDAASSAETPEAIFGRLGG